MLSVIDVGSLTAIVLRLKKGKFKKFRLGNIIWLLVSNTIIIEYSHSKEYWPRWKLHLWSSMSIPLVIKLNGSLNGTKAKLRRGFWCIKYTSERIFRIQWNILIINSHIKLTTARAKKTFIYLLLPSRRSAFWQIKKSQAFVNNINRVLLSFFYSGKDRLWVTGY